MLILVVEDDEYKRKAVTAALASACPGHDIIHAESVHSGIRRIANGTLALMVVDMSMPMFDIDVSIQEDGGISQATGGRHLIRELQYRGSNCPVIAVTQFDFFGQGRDRVSRDALDKSMQAEFGRQYLGIVHFDVRSDSWQAHLRRLIPRVLRGKP